ncbi:MoxR family ATPase [Paenibacillus sp. YIM B09110]|uniref:MoxR family ATPase n=1 Tax=Paenibacillus sp. YIM B09110 TaxID=3126102 RepID=UPI00301E3B01
MNITSSITQNQLVDVLLNVAVVRPVFVWGAPGIGKSSLVQQFADRVGLPCVSLLGSQLAPEDLIGVPQIIDGKSRFCPPSIIAREDPYCLFLDELNACTHEVQKAFYSLILEKRIGEFTLPEGSVVIAAGNRAQDSAIVKPLSSALVNRMFHVQLKVSHQEWLEWAYQNDIHPLILEYIQTRPDHLWTLPPKHEEPFSTPRSWHMLSDALKEYGERLDNDMLEILTNGCLTPHHAGQFRAFHKQLKSKYELKAIMEGNTSWPYKPEDRDVLYFLSQSFRAQLIKDLPESKDNLSEHHKKLSHRSKALIKELSAISMEMAQLVAGRASDGETLPDWFLVELVRDLPRLAQKKDN